MAKKLGGATALLLDAWDDATDTLQGITEARMQMRTAALNATAEFDWNDRTSLFEGGPRAARDRRASRFADC